MPRSESDRNQRLSIRDQMLQDGRTPYPQDGHKTHTNEEALAQPVNTDVIIAGRVSSIREHGKINFYDVTDGSGTIQAVLKDGVTDDLSNLKLFDRGDHIRVSGTRYETKSGQQSVLGTDFDMLSKSLRPLPDSWTGLSNEETRYRNRSVDMLMNKEVVDVIKQRSAIVKSVRQTLDGSGYLEVETPTLQPLYGGANAEPFLTHINAWNIPQYLKISDELYLKYMIMGGIDRVYEIDHNFRNEGVDKSHNPEFTMMECYSAYSDYNDMMDLTEEIYKNAAIAANGSPVVEYQGTEIDFSKPWKRLPLKQAIKQYLSLDVDTMSDEEIQSAIKEHGEHYKGAWNRGLGIAKLFGAVEPSLVQPTFIIDHPRETTSLCKPHRDDPSLIERFEPFVMGMEIGNAYTELNDPILQRQFWEEERKDDPDAHPLDEAFIQAMEYGMPPTGGLGLGIDRMVMLLTNQTKIRDVIIFPTMKPEANK